MNVTRQRIVEISVTRFEINCEQIVDTEEVNEIRSG